MNKLEFLGRGSGYNVTEGNTCGFIIKDETLLLIDCGEGIFEKVVTKNLIDGIQKIVPANIYPDLDLVDEFIRFEQKGEFPYNIMLVS